MGKVRRVKSGDTIILKDKIISINRIENQRFVDGYIEIWFYDTENNYINWNQKTDGGRITRSKVEIPIKRENLASYIGKKLLPPKYYK
jgi:hypothetical protein